MRENNELDYHDPRAIAVGLGGAGCNAVACLSANTQGELKNPGD